MVEPSMVNMSTLMTAKTAARIKTKRGLAVAAVSSSGFRQSAVRWSWTWGSGSTEPATFKNPEWSKTATGWQLAVIRPESRLAPAKTAPGRVPTCTVCNGSQKCGDTCGDWVSGQLELIPQVKV